MAGGPAVPSAPVHSPFSISQVLALHVQLLEKGVRFSFWSPLASGLGWWETDASSVCHYCHPSQVPVSSCRLHVSLTSVPAYPDRFRFILALYQFPSWLLNLADLQHDFMLKDQMQGQQPVPVAQQLPQCCSLTTVINLSSNHLCCSASLIEP